jgi:GH18 family chitinase
MRQFNKLWLLITLIIVFISGCKKDNPSPEPTPTPAPIFAPPDFGFKVVGYFPYYRNVATMPDTKFKMTNVVNYAFFTVNGSSGLTLNSASTFTAVVAKAKLNNAKIFMSVNGAAADFKTSTATAAGRNTLIKTIMDYVRQYVLDGVDMDWEFPTTSDGTHTQFTALMKELGDSLHTNGKYYLTAAITPGKYAGGIRDGVENAVFNYVDWFNVMVYDDFNTTVPYRHHSDMALVTSSINYWLTTRAMPANKFVLGLPGYGRPSGITQSNTVLTYAGILGQGGSSTSDSATVTASGYATPFTIYYNGQTTIKLKTMVAKQKANGVMLWEKGQDTNDNTSLLKAVCDTIGRAY